MEVAPQLAHHGRQLRMINKDPELISEIERDSPGRIVFDHRCSLVQPMSATHRHRLPRLEVLHVTALMEGAGVLPQT